MAQFPQDWYWVVGGDETRVYSSAREAYVAPTDATYVAWLQAASTPSRIDTEVSLGQVLWDNGVPVGPLPQPVPEVITRVQLRRQMLTMSRTDGQTSPGKLLDQVDAGIAGAGDLDLLQYWNESTEFHRHHEKILQMAAVFHLSSDLVDANWITASQLT